MSDIERKIKDRFVPDILTFKSARAVVTQTDFEKRRKEILSLISEHEYGILPERPDHLRVEPVTTDRTFAAGKATFSELKFTVTVGERELSFPVHAVIPNKDGKMPAFVKIANEPQIPNKFLPAEEISDCGFAVFSFLFSDITDENSDFSRGFAKLLSPARRKLNSPGKILMWSWAAMRVMDYLEALDYIDSDGVAVIGHGVLGTAALLAGAHDERFKYVISNSSGTSGAALTRGKRGENLANIALYRDFLFCPRYKSYVTNENSLPLDQHFLLAAIAPRHILVGSAKEDSNSDFESEFLSTYLAGEVYEKIYGIPSFKDLDEVPKAPVSVDRERLHYHLRDGLSYLSREDWAAYINYIKEHRKKR